TVSGWSADLGDSELGPLQVKVDGTAVGTATMGVSRPDICSVYLAVTACPNIGFTYKLNGFALAAGTHTVSVSATDAAGYSSSASVTVTAPAHLPLTYLESPAPGAVVSG